MTNSDYDMDSWLSKLYDLIIHNQKALTQKQISAITGVPVTFVADFLKVLYATDYFKIKKSPSGRFIQAFFNKFSKKLVYNGRHYVLEQGRCVHGDDRNMFFTYSPVEKAELIKLEEQASNKGLFYVYLTLDKNTFLKIFKKEMQAYALAVSVKTVPVIFSTSPTSPAEKPTSNTAYADPLECYPLVKAEVHKWTKRLEALETEIEEEIALNAKNAQWYEQEYAKARAGLRRKDEAYEVYIGQERVVGVEFEKSWFDDEPTRFYTESFRPVYETRYRSVVDWPTPPVVLNEKQTGNRPKIILCQVQLDELKSNFIVCEKQLQQAAEKQAKIDHLQKQKKALESQIKSLL